MPHIAEGIYESRDEPDDSRPWHERHPRAWRFLVGFVIGAVSYLIGYAAGRQDRS